MRNMMTAFAAVAIATTMVAGCSSTSNGKSSGSTIDPATVDCHDSSLTQAQYDAACGPAHLSTESSSSTSTGGAKRTNPVEILKLVTGCVIPPGVTVGNESAFGTRYADCDLPDEQGDTNDGNQISVYMYDSDDVLQQIISAAGGGSTDGTKLIVGKDFVLEDTGTLDLETNGTDFFPDPADIAKEVGGTLR